MTKDHEDYIKGVEVSEELVASDLGFKDVHAFRRWQTDLGRKVAELDFARKAAIDERNRFRHHGRRMQRLLERIEPTLTDPTMKLAIGVVLGKASDWDKQLAGWFDDIPLDPSPWTEKEGVAS